MPKISVVIRARDEGRELEELLPLLKGQISPSSSEIELIVVDNESRDGTARVALKFGAKVVNLPRGAFTYPKSMNLGVEQATAPIVVLTVAHARPVGTRWLEAALEHFGDPSVAAVYGPELPLQNATLAERVVFPLLNLISTSRHPIVKKRRGMFVLNGTNLAIRKSLWEMHHFDERYEMGGEDAEWARWAYDEMGCNTIVDRRMLIRHSHHLGFIGVIKWALHGWRYMTVPRKFDRTVLRYRKDHFGEE